MALVKESRGFRVDDVELLAGAPVDSRPTMVKQVLRLEIARPEKRDRPAPVTGEARKLDVPAGEGAVFEDFEELRQYLVRADQDLDLHQHVAPLHARVCRAILVLGL